MRYYKNLIFPEKCKGIIDVTKAPYFVDNKGKADCTNTIIRIINELTQATYDGMQKAYQNLKTLPAGSYLGKNYITENKVVDTEIVAMYPEELEQTPVIYFPNGTYLVSDTLSYMHQSFTNMRFSRVVGGFELNRCIRILGQNRDKTIIRLKDNCKGFEYGNERPVISFIQGETSNIAMSNYIENITVDIGVGNPGAVGVKFFSNNTGAVRHVLIRSSDPNYAGAAGLLISNELASGSYIRGLEVDGFRCGIKVLPRRLYVVMEELTLQNQTKEGIRIGDMPVSIRKIKFKGNVPAIFVQGPSTQAFITDGDFISEDTSIYPAVKVEQGCVYLRNLKSKGFKNSLNLYWDEIMLPDGEIPEYCTRETFSFAKEGVPITLNLPVPPLPDVSLEEDFSKWACVNDFGAVGDGKTDDTASVEAAFRSGNPVIWFQPGKYFISRTVDIPDNVIHVHFMYCDIAAGEALKNDSQTGVFRISGDTNELLFIEKMFQWESCFGEVRMFQHDSERPVYFRDMHTQSCAMYFNTTAGAEVHFENTACTIGDSNNLRHVPAFHFKNQKVWAHWLNPERSEHEAINDGGTLWILGFKCEHEGSIETYNQGVTEILGGLASVGRNVGTPFIVNDRSTVCAMFTTNGYKTFSLHPVAVQETTETYTQYLYAKDMPLRYHPAYYFVPLYSTKISEHVQDLSQYQRDALVY